MAGGDSMAVDVALDADAEATLTTQAAEKIYRSEGDETQVSLRLSLAGGSRLDWLPQEHILFDGARLRRSLDVTMAADARLLVAESVVFGRSAMGEIVRTGGFHDRWRIRRDGRLVFAEDVRLDGPVHAVLARPAIGAGARAVATILLVSPDAESQVQAAREIIGDAPCEAGIGALHGILIARLLGPDAAVLRETLTLLITRLRGHPLPRAWTL
jgi:urease accessory protein